MANSATAQAIFDAAASSNLGRVRALISEGADVNQMVNGMTPLVAACAPSMPNFEVIQALCDAGADANLGEATFPLKQAASRNNVELAKLLLANGADPNRGAEDGATALMAAATWEDPHVLRLLLDAGADPNQENDRGETALTIAIDYNNPEAEQLLRVHTTVETSERPWRSEHSVDPPHKKLTAAAGGGDAEFVRQLLREGVVPDSYDRTGSTALHKAAAAGRVEIVEELLNAGANIELRDGIGATPLLSASDWGQPRVLAVLIARGADAKVQDSSGRTGLVANLGAGPLMNLEVIDLLLTAGADPNQPDRAFRMTPLQWLEAQGDRAEPGVVQEIRQRLIESGARTDG